MRDGGGGCGAVVPTDEGAGNTLQPGPGPIAPGPGPCSDDAVGRTIVFVTFGTGRFTWLACANAPGVSGFTTGFWSSLSVGVCARAVWSAVVPRITLLE